MDYNITCTTCGYPSMISGSFISGSQNVNGFTCTHKECSFYYVLITTSN